MNEFLFQLSRFVFFFTLALLLTLSFLVALYSLKYACVRFRMKRIEKHFLFGLRNTLFASSPPNDLNWLKVRGRAARRALEDLMIRVAGEAPPSGEAFQRLAAIWKSLGYEDENLRRLKSLSEAEKVRALLSLGLFGQDASRKHIRELLHHLSEKVRWAATYALFGLRDEKSLQQILESVSSTGRFSLIELESDLFQLSKEGIFSLEEALQHPEPEVRILALGIVGRLKQGEFLRFIGRLLEDPVLDVRMKALNALVQLSSASKGERLPHGIEAVLSERLTEGPWEEMARLLQVIGAWKLTPFIPDVEAQVTHLHPWVRYRALETLLQLGPEGRRRASAILSEYRHIAFPIMEDLDVRNDVEDQ